MRDDLEKLNEFIAINSVSASPDSFVVVPDDNNDLPRPIRALRANVSGVVACYTAGSPTTPRLLYFASGETRCVLIIRVLATGTTADGLEAMP